MKKKTSRQKTDEPKFQVKFFLAKEEHRRLRVAAALRDQSLADYCSDAVKRQLEITLKGVSIPDLEN